MCRPARDALHGGALHATAVRAPLCTARIPYFSIGAHTARRSRAFPGRSRLPPCSFAPDGQDGSPSLGRALRATAFRALTRRDEFLPQYSNGSSPGFGIAARATLAATFRPGSSPLSRNTFKLRSPSSIPRAFNTSCICAKVTPFARCSRRRSRNLSRTSFRLSLGATSFTRSASIAPKSISPALNRRAGMIRSSASCRYSTCLLMVVPGATPCQPQRLSRTGRFKS